MAEESEKRFHAVMDKLFLAPSSPSSNSKSTKTPPSTSATAGGFSRGRKRPYTMTTTLALVDPKSKGSTIEELRNATVKSPMCRPWDREDLLKRLATFKSMTWFAKPEVVSAINCARRGWINVDMDIIACESCGARLLFSTPSSWPQQQVENAASVFSLKLNNGHKLLCPWVDNGCEEKLAQFPPISPANLVDNYKKRCASLLQLLELPVISSTAVDYMQSPLLEHFLRCPPTTIDECEEVLPVLYYQAQKLISLCGWEPRLLPYIVDCKDIHDQSTNDETAPDSSGRNTSITVYSSHTSENIESNHAFFTENEQYDHTSVVLDCKFCGARVGLWAFRTTPRPAEFVRLIEHTNHHILEPSNPENGEHTSANRNVLNLTIAGGPLPAEQNFRPTICLPVVGQNLRTRFSSAFESVDAIGDNKISNSGDDAPEDLANVETVNSVDLESFKTHGADKSALDHVTNLNNVSDTNVQTPRHPLDSSPSYLGKDSKAMEFDPIKQHRHFCPWIASTGKPTPGWKQTLLALERLNYFDYPSDITQPLSSLIEVADPVGSVKKLLNTPPSGKRKKFTHGSS